MILRKSDQESTHHVEREGFVRHGALLRIVLYLLLLFTPLVLVSIFRPQTEHNFIYELGKNFALLGLTILVLQFVLAARLRWLEEPFGLDVMMGFHQFMGIFATVLLLFHPILLALGGKGWSLLISPGSPWYIWVARTALLMVLIHTSWSIIRMPFRLEFQKWLRWHNVLVSLIIPFGFLHSWYTGGDLTLLQLRVLWVSFFALAFLTHIYRRILCPIGLRRHAYRVIEVLAESHNTWTIKLAPPGGENRFSYLPGQFHFITIYSNRNLPCEEHPYTISSSPSQSGFVTSTIKQSGDFTASIAHTKPGDRAVIHGPFGRFSYLLHPKERDLVFIAGGVGITPMISMLRHMRDTQSDLHVSLLYANKTRRDILFYDELSGIESGAFPRLKVVHFLSRADPDWNGESGYLDGRRIKHLCGGNLENKAFYLCGPPMMTGQIIRDLYRAGVGDDRIHFERFTL